MNKTNQRGRTSDRTVAPNGATAKTRGAAIRAQQRNRNDADKIVGRYASVDAAPSQHKRANTIAGDTDKLKITFLGGLEDVGEKNMTIIEYGGDALILDCGLNLHVDLPGVNYAICDTAYLETIRHKIRAYVVTHGHLDHMGGLRHIAPQFPAPIYGSRYTIGVIEHTFAEEQTGFVPQLHTIDIDNHTLLSIGVFRVEFVRVTHAIPDPAAICITTPIGRIIATGDFRLDPEPLDNMPSDKARLRQLGDEGVLLLMSDSSYANAEGRTPTESTLQPSYYKTISGADGRVFVAVFSSNINRIQMVVNAAVATGRSVAFDGRSMLAYAEIAVRQGILKIPKGAMVSLSQTVNLPDNQVLVMCTGGQGEPNAALQRMSEGEHKHIKLRATDTVIISSTPIPGNETAYDQISNRLSSLGVRLFRHATHELDGCGPLHVSGHARRDEMAEMIQLVRPRFFVPVHGGHLRRRYHADVAVQQGIARENTALLANGDSLYFTADRMEHGETVPHGSVLVDQTGSPVSGLVVKDRLLLGQEGILTVVLTVDKRSGQLLTSPDIISRGFIAMRDSGDLMDQFRAELRRAVEQRFLRVDLDRFKAELRDFATHFLFDRIGRSPIVIPVVNVIGGKVSAQTVHDSKTTTTDRTTDQERFQALRARLLGQDQRD